MSNPHSVLIIGGFNVKSSNWSSNDTTTAEGAQLDYIYIFFTLHKTSYQQNSTYSEKIC